MGRKKKEIQTFDELIAPYLKVCRHQKDYKNKEYRTGVLSKIFGNKKLSTFNAAFLREFVSDLLLKGLSKATCNRYLSLISNMLKYAEELGVVDDKVVYSIGKVKSLKEENERHRYVSEEELSSLKAACSGSKQPYLLEYVLFPLNTGMRRGEVNNLTWDRIDIRNRVITLPTSKNGKPRIIPMNDNIVAIIGSIPVGSGKVFSSSYADAWKNAVKRSGLKDLHYHDLRHTFASWLAMRNVDMPTLRDILGHKDISTTSRYSHVSNEHKTNAVSLLNNII